MVEIANLVIAAIPDENDRVWKVSSEKIPHLTLLFLGDVGKVANLDKIITFVEHAASTTLRRFYLPVDRRGELGADQADVLFFKKGRYDYKAIRDFRATLLQDNNIKTAYDSATQFDGVWQPHLTLGYPADPAKPDPTDRDFGFYDVGFNKIAVWTGDFEGPDFLLKDYWDEWEAMETVPMDVAMSDISSMLNEDVMTKTADLGAEVLAHLGLKSHSMDLSAEFLLEHYGIKGMRWGQSKAPPTAVTTTATSRVPHGMKRRTKIQVEGGENHPAHEDAIKVAQSRAKLKKSGAASLSNNELRDMAARIQLEQQVKQLTTGGGKKFVSGLLKSQGQQSAGRVITRKAVAKGF